MLYFFQLIWVELTWHVSLHIWFFILKAGRECDLVRLFSIIIMYIYDTLFLLFSGALLMSASAKLLLQLRVL